MSGLPETTWMTLVQAGIVQGPAPKTEIPESPWYVKGLLAISGWLAACFFLFFIGIGFVAIIKSGPVSFTVGSLMIAGAFAIIRLPKNEFWEHMALALSFAGQGLIVWSFLEIWKNHDEWIWLLVGLLEVFLAIVIPNFVHRVASTSIAAFALSRALSFTGGLSILISLILVLAAYLWLNEFWSVRHLKTVQAFGYGLVLALIELKGSTVFGTMMLGEHSPHGHMEDLLAVGVNLYIVWQLLQRYDQPITGRLGMMAVVGTLILGIVSIGAQGITIGMAIMVLGFAGSNRVLLGLGITSLLFFISMYYYQLNATLLVKAQVLLIVGIVLLACRWAMGYWFPKEPKANHA